MTVGPAEAPVGQPPAAPAPPASAGQAGPHNAPQQGPTAAGAAVTMTPAFGSRSLSAQAAIAPRPPGGAPELTASSVEPALPEQPGASEPGAGGTVAGPAAVPGGDPYSDPQSPAVGTHGAVGGPVPDDRSLGLREALPPALRGAVGSTSTQGPAAATTTPPVSAPPAAGADAAAFRAVEHARAAAGAAAEQNPTPQDEGSQPRAEESTARLDAQTPQAVARAAPVAGAVLAGSVRASTRSDAGARVEGTPSPTVSSSRPEAPLPGPPASTSEVAPGQTAGPGGPLLDSGVDMQGMIDSIHATIELAARQGISQARISLEPAELGQIRIHLSQTGEGLLARVTAETPAAAQALAAGRADLHQSLSSLGTSLLRLDIGSFGQPEGREGRHAAGASGSGSGRAGETTEGGESIDSAGGPDASSATPPHALGELVDVLA